MTSVALDLDLGALQKFPIDFKVFQWKCLLQNENGLALSKIKFHAWHPVPQTFKRCKGLYYLCLKGQGHQDNFYLRVRAPYEEIVNFYCQNFKGNKTMTRGQGGDRLRCLREVPGLDVTTALWIKKPKNRKQYLDPVFGSRGCCGRSTVLVQKYFYKLLDFLVGQRRSLQHCSQILGLHGTGVNCCMETNHGY